MNKQLWMATFLIVAMMVLSGCAINAPATTDSQKECDNYTLSQVRSDAALAQRCAEAFGFSYNPSGYAENINDSEESEGSVADASQPVATPAPAATAAALNFGNCQAPDFSQYVGKPYELIAVLDEQDAKVDQPLTSFTLNAEANCLLYWTGAYVSPMPSGLQPLIVDGKTGVFLVPSGMVTVNFVGAYMPLSAFNPNVQVVADAGLPTGCMDKAKVIEGLNQHHGDTEALVRWLDSQVNVNGAPYLQARIRPNPLGPATYSNQTPVTMIFWVRDGSVAGKEGQDWVYLSRGNGIGVYLIATDRAEITWAHTGLKVCDDGIHPDTDLNFWK